MNTRLEDALAKLSPKIRDAFLRAMQAHASGIDIAALVDALERKDLAAAAEIVKIKDGQLYQITEAIRAGYVDAGANAAAGLPLAIRSTFGFGVNPRAMEAVDRITGDFITQFTDGQRETTKAIISGVVDDGIPVRTAALDIAGRINAATGLREGGYIDLDGPRAEIARKVKAILSDPERLREYFVRDAETGNWKPRYTTTDRRFDRTVLNAIRDGKPMDAKTIDKLTATHRTRLLRDRAETISRNEGLNALRAGERAGFQAMVDNGTVADDRIVREWIPTKDARTRHDHMVMAGQKRVGMGTPFTFPDGGLAMFPGDTSLDASPHDLIQCRCQCSYRLKRKSEA